MTPQQLEKLTADFTNESPDNFIREDIALSPELIGQRMFEAPLLGFAAADDALFEEYKRPEVIGPHFRTPREWMPGCRSIVSFFVPFTKALTLSNSKDYEYPSNYWLHGRIEGQVFVNKLAQFLIRQLTEAGFESMAPSLNAGFSFTATLEGADGKPLFTSNWSERHVAFAAGLGTFGLSKGLITKKGMAGRIGSVLTQGVFPPTVRAYQDIYEYCIHCGLCIEHCPANAISFERGKEHPPCHIFLEDIRAKRKPWYGCGKCQMKVPCTFGVPKKRKNVS